MQLLGNRESSYVVVRKKGDCHEPIDRLQDEKLNDELWTVEANAKNRFTFDDNDSYLSRCLWKLGQNLISEHSMVNVEHHKNLGYVNEAGVKSFDLTGLITMIIPFNSPNGPLGCIRIWDGTGTSNSDW